MQSCVQYRINSGELWLCFKYINFIVFPITSSKLIERFALSSIWAYSFLIFNSGLFSSYLNRVACSGRAFYINWAVSLSFLFFLFSDLNSFVRGIRKPTIVFFENGRIIRRNSRGGTPPVPLYPFFIIRGREMKRISRSRPRTAGSRSTGRKRAEFREFSSSEFICKAASMGKNGG